MKRIVSILFDDRYYIIPVNHINLIIIYYKQLKLFKFMRSIDIFTDGSHIKGLNSSGRLGIGGVMVIDGRMVNQFSAEIDKDVIKKLYGTDDVSNPTMELYAVLRSLMEFKDDLSSDDIINYYSDYKGVSEWLNDKWKVNKPYISKIKDNILELARKNNLHIKYNWVKGHSGGTDYYSMWNDRADSLANPR